MPHLSEDRLTPGVIDGAAEHAFSYGACAALAYALHEATGWPIIGITDSHNRPLLTTSLDRFLRQATRQAAGHFLRLKSDTGVEAAAAA